MKHSWRKMIWILNYLFSGCVDNPKYADICPSIATCGQFCSKNQVWAKKNCPKSCNMCPPGMFHTNSWILLVEIQPTFFISSLFLPFSVFLTLIKEDTSPSFASPNDFCLVPLQTVVCISSYWEGWYAYYKVVHSSHSRKVSLPKSDNTQEHHW